MPVRKWILGEVQKYGLLNTLDRVRASNDLSKEDQAEAMALLMSLIVAKLG